jgi:cytochrome c oxidase subunit 2
MKSISSKLASLLLNLGIAQAPGSARRRGLSTTCPAAPRSPAQPAPAHHQDREEQHWLHNFMLILCTVIFIAVFAVMFYSIWKHRKSVGHKPANFHESVTVEVIWTIVPFIIVILMALPATKVLVASKDTTNADLTIKATGYQWKWGYDYLKGEGEGISFISTLDNTHREMSDSGAKGDGPTTTC